MVDTSFLFGSNPPSTYLSPVETNTQLPQWYQEAQRGLISRAAAIANEPYTPYGGPRVAGLTDLQNQAISGAATAGQAGGNTLNAASTLASQAGNTQFDPSQFQQFLNPYTSGVVNTIADLGARNLSENLLPQVNDTFVGSGMPFGSRHADFTARAVRDSNESIMNQQNQALQQSYDSAMGNYQGALQRQGQTAGIMAGIGAGQTQNQLQTGGYQQLMGATQQANQQANLDTAYGDFQNQRNYPAQQLDLVNSILRGYSPYQSITSNSTQGGANPGSTTQNSGTNALGALAAFYGQGH